MTDVGVKESSKYVMGGQRKYYKQYHGGKPVYGYGVYIDEKDGIAYHVLGRFAPHLTVSTTGFVSKEAAIATAVALLDGVNPWVGSATLHAPTADQMIATTRDNPNPGDFHLIWRVNFLGTGAPRLAAVDVEANTGAVLMQHSKGHSAICNGVVTTSQSSCTGNPSGCMVKTTMAGSIYPDNPQIYVTPQVDPANGPPIGYTLEDVSQNFSVVATEKSTDQIDAQSPVCSADFTTDETATSAAQLYYSLSKFYDAIFALTMPFTDIANFQFPRWVGLDGGNVAKVRVVVTSEASWVPKDAPYEAFFASPIKDPYIVIPADNQYWKKNGEVQLDPFVDPFTLGHEAGHAVVDAELARRSVPPATTSTLTLEGKAIHEGFGDVFGTFLNRAIWKKDLSRFNNLPSNEWCYGYVPGQGCMRDPSNPANSKDPSASVYQQAPYCTNDPCDEHTDSTILSLWAYLVTMGGSNPSNPCISVTPFSTDFDTSLTKTVRVLMGALQYVSEYPSFNNLANATKEAIPALYPADVASMQKTIYDAWVAVGVKSGVKLAGGYTPADTATDVTPWSHNELLGFPGVTNIPTFTFDTMTGDSDLQISTDKSFNSADNVNAIETPCWTAYSEIRNMGATLQPGRTFYWRMRPSTTVFQYRDGGPSNGEGPIVGVDQSNCTKNWNCESVQSFTTSLNEVQVTGSDANKDSDGSYIIPNDTGVLKFTWKSIPEGTLYLGPNLSGCSDPQMLSLGQINERGALAPWPSPVVGDPVDQYMSMRPIKINVLALMDQLPDPKKPFTIYAQVRSGAFSGKCSPIPVVLNDLPPQPLENLMPTGSPVLVYPGEENKFSTFADTSILGSDTTSITFQWQSVPGAASYDVYIMQDAKYETWSTPSGSTVGFFVGSSFYRAPGIAGNTDSSGYVETTITADATNGPSFSPNQYGWYVVAYSQDSAEIGWSEWFKFGIRSAAPQISFPETENTITSDKLTFANFSNADKMKYIGQQLWYNSGSSPDEQCDGVNNPRTNLIAGSEMIRAVDPTFGSQRSVTFPAPTGHDGVELNGYCLILTSYSVQGIPGVPTKKVFYLSPKPPQLTWPPDQAVLGAAERRGQSCENKPVNDGYPNAYGCAYTDDWHEVENTQITFDWNCAKDYGESLIIWNKDDYGTNNRPTAEFDDGPRNDAPMKCESPPQPLAFETICPTQPNSNGTPRWFSGVGPNYVWKACAHLHNWDKTNPSANVVCSDPRYFSMNVRDCPIKPSKSKEDPGASVGSGGTGGTTTAKLNLVSADECVEWSDLNSHRYLFIALAHFANQSYTVTTQLPNYWGSLTTPCTAAQMAGLSYTYQNQSGYDYIPVDLIFSQNASPLVDVNTSNYEPTGAFAPTQNGKGDWLTTVTYHVSADDGVNAQASADGKWVINWNLNGNYNTGRNCYAVGYQGTGLSWPNHPIPPLP